MSTLVLFHLLISIFFLKTLTCLGQVLSPNCSPDCENLGGICRPNENGDPICLCDGEPCFNNSGSGGGGGQKRDWVLKTVIGVSASVFTLIVVGVAVFIHRRRWLNQQTSYTTLSWLTSRITNSSKTSDDIEKGSMYPGVHVFTWGELDKATSHFSSTRELGDGGFASVYLGKLRDGRLVAVKKLHDNNYEQFMNEVKILTHLRHKNLVALYGCTSDKSQTPVLVYEYIPNGTIADHLHGKRSDSGGLSWTARMSIAVETASALAYLHASDVIHRDVKTMNILLDDNFIVKVADFGLSRLFPTHLTHISTAPQGTPGYVDPEYHKCYQLTDKSDVYSFGVVLIELISSQPAVDITRHRHEINLSSMAINKIQSHALHELVDPTINFESDEKVNMMVTQVAELAFRCLQESRDFRPTMAEVFEILQSIQKEGFDIKSGVLEDGLDLNYEHIGR